MTNKEQILLNQLINIIDDTQSNIEVANAIIDPIVSWISPVGDMFIERKSEIQAMVSTGSWR
jgi:hypothetical protein